LQSQLGNFQGKVAQSVGERLKSIKTELREDLSTAVREILTERDTTAAQEAAYVRELESQGLDEDQIRAVIQTNAKRQPAQPKAEPAKQQTQSFNDGYDWDAAERKALGRAVTGLLDGMDLADVEVSDQRLWAGVTPGITPDEAYNLVKANVKKIRVAPGQSRSTEQSTTTQQSAQTKTPPVSTQGAPATNAAQYESKADAAAAFVRREINIDEYRAVLSQL
jgi:hypothetical protein